ncbi:MAG: hypothetical protein HY611_01435 [Elusimicrobia bacterium]|nr:hypothetical protein [Elusimicrobiota bacterium]
MKPMLRAFEFCVLFFCAFSLSGCFSEALMLKEQSEPMNIPSSMVSDPMSMPLLSRVFTGPPDGRIVRLLGSKLIGKKGDDLLLDWSGSEPLLPKSRLLIVRQAGTAQSPEGGARGVRVRRVGVARVLRVVRENRYRARILSHTAEVLPGDWLLRP